MLRDFWFHLTWDLAVLHWAQQVIGGRCQVKRLGVDDLQFKLNAARESV